MDLIELKNKLNEKQQALDDALIHYRIADKQLQVLQNYTRQQHDKYLQLHDQCTELTKMIQRLCAHEDVHYDRCAFCDKVV